MSNSKLYHVVGFDNIYATKLGEFYIADELNIDYRVVSEIKRGIKTIRNIA